MPLPASNMQRGFSLIEVLVALVIFSIGVLAAVGLQAVSKKTNQNASQRVLATHLAMDLLERMRANTNPDANVTYLSQTLGTELGGGTRGSEPNPSCSDGSTCTAQQLAFHDLWEWEQRLDGSGKIVTEGGVTFAAGGLVDPAGCVFGPAAGGDGLYTVVVVWRGSTESQNPTTGDANIDSCANGADRYGTNNVYRRVVALSGFIAR